jgi:hypothetical protein
MVTPRRLSCCNGTETRVLARVDQVKCKQLDIVTYTRTGAIKCVHLGNLFLECLRRSKEPVFLLEP